MLVIAAIILVVYYNRKQDDEELETDFDSDDPKEAFELFNRVKERDRIDSDYNQAAPSEERFDISFENAFPAEMGIAAAVREVDEEEDMPKKFKNDYPMEEIEDITDELVKMSTPEILASNTQKIELDPKDIKAAEKANEEAELIAISSDNATAGVYESPGVAAVAATALAGAAAGMTEDIEDISDEVAGDGFGADVTDAALNTEDRADHSEDNAASSVPESNDGAIEGLQKKDGVNDSNSDIETADISADDSEPENPAIVRLKERLSGGIKSDEEISKGRSLKQVTYKDILMDDDFEEIEFRRGDISEKET